MIRLQPDDDTQMHARSYLDANCMHHLFSHGHVALVLKADDGLAIEIVPCYAQESGNGPCPRVPNPLNQRIQIHLSVSDQDIVW